MTLARKLHPDAVTADSQHASVWDDGDWTWLADHDPHADWRSPVPDPTAEQAIARVEREQRKGGR